MWISKTYYNFLKKCAEKNIDEECSWLKTQYIQNQDAIKTLKECANTLNTFNRLFGATNDSELNFYHAYYKKQYYDKYNGQWNDTCYDHQGIFVIANSYDDAKLKIEKCISKVEEKYHRAVLVSDITECIGINIRHGFEDSLYVDPIIDKQNIDAG